MEKFGYHERNILRHITYTMHKFSERRFVQMNNKALDCTALTLVIIGAINWGLVGFFKFDLVAFLFGPLSILSRIIYALVGICGLYLITFYGYCGGPDSE